MGRIKVGLVCFYTKECWFGIILMPLKKFEYVPEKLNTIINIVYEICIDETYN